MIISVSRRCDIPRFQFDWFMTRLNEGFVEVTNPYNANQIKRVSLLREDVDAFVFWTRDPRHILANAQELTNRGFPFYVMVSLTGYPAVLEPKSAPVQEIINSMIELPRIAGQERIIWRYDPIILTSVTDFDFHRRNFNELSQKLAGSVNRVIISIYDEYKGAIKRLDKLEQENKLQMMNTDEPEFNKNLHELLADIAKNAAAHGMEIQSCAEKEDFSHLGIKPGACIDSVLIDKISGTSQSEASCAKLARDKNQRPNCMCCKSVDIGAYRTCKAGCVYCYAS